jgi:hypothetical protein
MVPRLSLLGSLVNSREYSAVGISLLHQFHAERTVEG